MMQRTQALHLAPLLATTLVALACEKPPNPAAPKQPSFVTVDEKTDRITGGGKLDGGRDFATFGFNARPEQGQIEWVQHCLDGMGSGSCSLGSFTFHGSSVTGYGAPAEDPPHCRTWSGNGEAKFKDGGTADDVFEVKACDLGHPGRGTDFICFSLSLSGYLRSGTLSGGNIQRHEGSPENFENACSHVFTT